MIAYLSTAMVLIGVVIQALALAPARRLIEIIPIATVEDMGTAAAGASISGLA